MENQERTPHLHPDQLAKTFPNVSIEKCHFMNGSGIKIESIVRVNRDGVWYDVPYMARYIVSTATTAIRSIQTSIVDCVKIRLHFNPDGKEPSPDQRPEEELFPIDYRPKVWRE